MVIAGGWLRCRDGEGQADEKTESCKNYSISVVGVRSACVHLTLSASRADVHKGMAAGMTSIGYEECSDTSVIHVYLNGLET